MTARILLVEDEHLVALSLREALRDAGFEVECAHLSRTVTEDMRDVQWGAALVDMGLPDRSGSTVVQHLRQRQPLLPIILTTGLETPETHRFALEHGLTILPKPFDEWMLVDLLRHVLSTRRAASELLPVENGAE
jgi:DNA-binding response OmpR family regulator